jgi:Protein of unknown function (DUF2961)
MNASRKRALSIVLALVAAASVRCDDAATDVRSQAPPPLPLGYDAYLNWDRWPVLRIGTRTVMRSTFDRAGGNEGADASHFIREGPHGLVALDVAGTGVLSFVRTNRWHGSPWRYTVDGRTTEVSESATADPDHPPRSSTFIPESLFPSPLAVTWATTQGADLSWVRLPFERSLEIAYGRSHYGTGYYVMQLVAEGSEDTTTSIRSWDAASPPPREVLELLARAGTDIAPTDLRTASGRLDLPGGSSAARVTTIDGAGTLRALRFTMPRSAEAAIERTRLRVTWDGRAAPSIDAPLPLFFGAGSLENRDAKEWLVKALPVSIRFPPDGATIEFSAYFPMAFASGATIELVASDPIPGVAWTARWSDEAPRELWGYLHATYRDHGTPTPGEDLSLLDTQGIEGVEAWCGSVVGTSFIFSRTATLATLEGDPRFFFDDSDTPQVQGTGTEEWGGGGDYWGGRTMTLPFVGHPVGAPSPKLARNDRDRIESAYRFLLGDLMPFGRRARVGLEHGGTNESVEHYETVTYWYGRPDACLALVDTLDIGDVEDERRHAYAATPASEPYAVTSRHEVGVDRVAGREIVPAITDTGRKIASQSEFTLSLPEDNVGLLLRRTLDYAEPDQRADVYVADADDSNAQFRRAGTWYVAGSSARVLYENAPTETGDEPPRFADSGRRWRDDELLVDRHLTSHVRHLRVRIVVPPGSAWTEFRYRAYAWSLPR